VGNLVSNSGWGSFINLLYGNHLIWTGAIRQVQRTVFGHVNLTSWLSRMPIFGPRYNIAPPQLAPVEMPSLSDYVRQQKTIIGNRNPELAAKADAI
jgi:hypothetical protein